MTESRAVSATSLAVFPQTVPWSTAPRAAAVPKQVPEDVAELTRSMDGWSNRIGASLLSVTGITMGNARTTQQDMQVSVSSEISNSLIVFHVLLPNGSGSKASAKSCFPCH